MKKKSLTIIFAVAILVASTLFAESCKKDDPQIFGTPDEPVTDIEGNTYKTVKIGNQIWMAENLRTTKFNNGDDIPEVTVNATWTTLTTGAYCWYNNDVAKKATYGALYNWFAIADSRSIAPTGWHVATDEEWTTLTNYLGGEAVAGGKLKEIGTAHWHSPNTGATNEMGFTALGGGCRFYTSGSFKYLGIGDNYWCSSQFDATDAWTRNLDYARTTCLPYHHIKRGGNSVRCVKDIE